MATESMTPTSHLGARCTLLAMPPEIRLHIYQFCIPHNLCVDYSYFLWSPLLRYMCPTTGSKIYTDLDERTCPGLLLLCRQITNEVKPILYGSTTFVFKHTFTNRSFPFSPETKKLMQKVIICVLGDYKGFSPIDPSVWDDILLNLRQLGIVIEGRTTIHDPSFFEMFPAPERALSLTTILQYLGRALSNETQVIMDTNSEENFIESVENQMPGRCVFKTLRVRNKPPYPGWIWTSYMFN